VKRILIAVLSLLLVFSISSCASKNSGIESVNTNTAQTPNIQIVSQGTLGGSERNVYIDSNVGFVDASTDLSETFPVYINAYSYGQEGPLYEVTDLLRTTVTDNLSRYLGYLYDDFSPEQAAFSSDPGREYEVYYANNSTEVRSLMNSISVLSTEYAISNDITAPELLDNMLVKAAISYLGLTEPVVTQTTEYNNDGRENLRTYVITEKASTTLQKIFNHSFACVTVKKYVDSEDTIVQIGDVSTDELTKYADYPVLSYTSVLSKLGSYYPNMDTKDVKTEIYYSATVQPGYFFPCYRFYIKDGVTTKSDGNLYTIVDVLMTDKSVGD
jgi:hypothetical protein